MAARRTSTVIGTPCSHCTEQMRKDFRSHQTLTPAKPATVAIGTGKDAYGLCSAHNRTRKDTLVSA
jgi:phosphoribosyl 1,2-cyclic phosphodiesterase